MNKSTSVSIRVSKEELDRIKQAAKEEEYSSCSEFIRRTALIEANKIIQRKSTNTKVDVQA